MMLYRKNKIKIELFNQLIIEQMDDFGQTRLGGGCRRKKGLSW